jgi:hypothetical protein
MRSATRWALPVLLAAVVWLGSLGSAPEAGAQALPPIDYSQYDVLLGTLGLPNLPEGKRRGDRPGRRPPDRGRPRVRPPTPAQLRSLRFRPRTAVTRRLYDQVSAESGLDPDHVETQLDAARTEYRRVLIRRVGWRVADLGDAAAFSLLQAYLQVSEDADAPRAGLRLLRRAVRADLARQRAVRRLSDAGQQRIAETLELRTIFLISNIVGAQRTGDAAAERAARRAMRRWARSVFGIDLAGLALTKRGFTRD